MVEQLDVPIRRQYPTLSMIEGGCAAA